MDKPKYIFEGSGAPEAKLKPRDGLEDLLRNFKEAGLTDRLVMPFDISNAITSPEQFWSSLETGLKIFGEYKVYSQIILDFRSDAENFELIRRMIEMGVIPQPILLKKDGECDLVILSAQIAVAIEARKLEIAKGGESN